MSRGRRSLSAAEVERLAGVLERRLNVGLAERLADATASARTALDAGASSDSASDDDGVPARQE